jgi:hypothetical protein
VLGELLVSQESRTSFGTLSVIPTARNSGLYMVRKRSILELFDSMLFSRRDNCPPVKHHFGEDYLFRKTDQRERHQNHHSDLLLKVMYA